MSRKHLLTVAVGDPAGLGAFLAARLGIAEAVAAAWIARGAVQVGGARARGDEVLRPGARVTAREPVGSTASGADEALVPGLVIVHRDAELLVIDKPAGLLSQPSVGELDSLERRVRAIDAAARLAHRLDRDTSGLVVFTRTAPAHAALQQQLAAGEVERAYLAVCAGRLERARTICLRIAPDPDDASRRRALPEAASGGQAARTEVTPLGELLVGGAAATRLEVTLRTGRTHQIRVHLSAIGHPLVGDRLYGGPEAPRLLLHAARLAFRHPASGERLVLSAAAPHGFST